MAPFLFEMSGRWVKAFLGVATESDAF